MSEASSTLSIKRNKKLNELDQTKLGRIRSKLSDGKYVYNAIYCLASILTDRVMDLGGKIDDGEEKPTKKRENK